MSSMQTQVGFIKFNYEFATARLTIWDNGVAFVSGVHSRVRGKGHATKVLSDIIDYADAQGLTLQLHVQQYGPPQDTLNNKQLEEFYGKFGFVTVPDSGRPILMERFAQ